MLKFFVNFKDYFLTSSIFSVGNTIASRTQTYMEDTQFLTCHPEFPSKKVLKRSQNNPGNKIGRYVISASQKILRITNFMVKQRKQHIIYRHISISIYHLATGKILRNIRHYLLCYASVWMHVSVSICFSCS